MGKTFKDNPNKWRKHSDNKPKKQKGNKPQRHEHVTHESVGGPINYGFNYESWG